MELVKARLYNADTNTAVVQCQFNPSELSINKSNSWQTKATSGSNVPEMHFAGEGALTLTMSLMFDTYEEHTDVSAITSKVLGLMEAGDVTTPTGTVKRPPHVQFGWGLYRSFRGVITRVDQRFTLFLPNGTPVRATLTVNLQEVPKEGVKQRAWGQNPTSVAAGVRRARVVQPGDTIDWIAASELDDPTAWRLLAEANNLDDPRRLRPGQTLLIPPGV